MYPPAALGGEWGLVAENAKEPGPNERACAPAASDIDGVTGMAILRAIAQGERGAKKLANLRDRRGTKPKRKLRNN